MSDDNRLIKTLLESIQEANDKQTKELKYHIDKEIETLKKIIQDETEKRTKLETQYNNLKEKYQNLEKALRKNNILIFGLQNDTEKSLIDFTIETLNRHLNITLIRHDINNIFTIGKQKQSKPIIVKFVSYMKKIEILKAAPRLKGTNISIAEELTIEERNRNKILKKNLREARSKGLTAYIKYNKLYVNEEEFTAEQLADNEKDPLSESEDSEETKKEDERTETLRQSNNETTKANSAPPTPTQVNKRFLETDGENEHVTEEQADALTKKRKVIQTVPQRYSPRLYETEKKK